MCCPGDPNCIVGQELPGPVERELWRERRKAGQWVGSWPSDEVFESELAGTRHQHKVGYANDTAGFSGRPWASIPRLWVQRAFREVKQLPTQQRGPAVWGNLRVGRWVWAGFHGTWSIPSSTPSAPALKLNSTIQRGTWLELPGPNGMHERENQDGVEA